MSMFCTTMPERASYGPSRKYCIPVLGLWLHSLCVLIYGHDCGLSGSGSTWCILPSVDGARWSYYCDGLLNISYHTRASM
ncbi:hypothetical protein L227DRAFT_27630 [Lentinus tigrinus ALCF2SS1-6]|uniref:Uncharacterized protein n=1 Tax=Lentinus tigrinus ALCF2SS1-6 TaxID=1328759 RepID=A0A5C2SVA9_9APHY|nr:hypothetical protein L227DRAFT_27630 [Lentinus tigrinus ALCF2SS1-6]